jgi:hypothetical protein
MSIEWSDDHTRRWERMLRFAGNRNTSPNAMLEIAADLVLAIDGQLRSMAREVEFAIGRESEAKKAGTPYAADRDTINALILRNQKLEDENRRLLAESQ